MIIGIVGRSGSGKDTVADILVQNHGFVKVAFADPIKRILQNVFDFSDEQLWGSSSKRNEPDPRYPRRMSGCPCDATTCSFCYLTPRFALQQLGTEWGRECYLNVWVDYALRTAKQLLDSPLGFHFQYSPIYGLGPAPPGIPPARGVVISDVRFPNEATALKAHGARIWKTSYRGGSLTGEARQHSSEGFTDELPVDALVQPSPLPDLPGVVAALLLATSTPSGDPDEGT